MTNFASKVADIRAQWPPPACDLESAEEERRHARGGDGLLGRSDLVGRDKLAGSTPSRRRGRRRINTEWQRHFGVEDISDGNIFFRLAAVDRSFALQGPGRRRAPGRQAPLVWAPPLPPAHAQAPPVHRQGSGAAPPPVALLRRPHWPPLPCAPRRRPPWQRPRHAPEKAGAAVRRVLLEGHCRGV